MGRVIAGASLWVSSRIFAGLQVFRLRRGEHKAWRCHSTQAARQRARRQDSCTVQGTSCTRLQRAEWVGPLPLAARRMEVGRQLPVRGTGPQLHRAITPDPDSGRAPGMAEALGDGPVDASAGRRRSRAGKGQLCASRTNTELGPWGRDSASTSAAAAAQRATSAASRVLAHILAQSSRGRQADALSRGHSARGWSRQPKVPSR